MSEPSLPAFFRAFDRRTLAFDFEGVQLSLHTGQGLFSADRIDEGTRLLLAHVPTAARILDMGCGYGALGLPLAGARQSSLLCVDRDVVAVRYAERNAQALGNVLTRASLGYDAVSERFDLVLCNVPARIGEAGLAHLVEGGMRCASEVRVVVIRDLAELVEKLAPARGWRTTHVARGERHDVFAIAGGQVDTPSSDASLYARDEIEYEGLAFARPHDASDDPSHAREGVPLLLELLPKRPRGRALVWRSAHGVAATLLARRGMEVIAADRDLLALAFAQRNATRHGVSIETRAAAWLPEIDARVDLVVMEPSTSAGDRVALAELEAARKCASVIILAQATIAPALTRSSARPAVLASRGPWRLLRC